MSPINIDTFNTCMPWKVNGDIGLQYTYKSGAFITQGSVYKALRNKIATVRFFRAYDKNGKRIINRIINDSALNGILTELVTTGFYSTTFLNSIKIKFQNIFN